MMKKLIICGLFALLLGAIIIAFRQDSPHDEMIRILQKINKQNNNTGNPFNQEAKIAFYDSLLKKPGNSQNQYLLSAKASLLLKAGKEDQSVKIYENLLYHMDFMLGDNMLPDLGIAYMRLGERNNCMLNHNGSSVLPSLL